VPNVRSRRRTCCGIQDFPVFGEVTLNDARVDAVRVFVAENRGRRRCSTTFADRSGRLGVRAAAAFPRERGVAGTGCRTTTTSARERPSNDLRRSLRSSGNPTLAAPAEQIADHMRPGSAAYNASTRSTFCYGYKPALNKTPAARRTAVLYGDGRDDRVGACNQHERGKGHGSPTQDSRTGLLSSVSGLVGPIGKARRSGVN